MKYKQLAVFLISAVLLSCSEWVRDEKVEPLSEPNATVKLVDTNVFVSLLASIPNVIVRKEARQKFDALKFKYNKNKNLPLSSINKLFESLIEEFPLLRHDKMLLNLSKAYEKVAAKKIALNMLDKIIVLYPDIEYVDKVQFQRAKLLFEMRQYLRSEYAYKKVILHRGTALYKDAVYWQGWSQFKQTHYNEALNSFMHLLDLYSREGEFDFQRMEAEDKKFVDKITQAINLSFDNLAGPVSVYYYFSKKQKRQYEYHIFVSLAEYYKKQNKISEAAKVYQLFVRLNEQHIESPDFLLKVIALYKKNGFEDAFLDAQKNFVLRYPAEHAYWRLHSKNKTANSFKALNKNLEQLVNYYYELSKKTNLASDYRQAQRWCRLYLMSFSNDINAWNVEFKLAELLQLTRLYEMAALQYERVAYDYKKRSDSSAAAYSALLMYEKRLAELAGFEKKYWHKLQMDSAQRFVASFPEHEKVNFLKTRIIKNQYAKGGFDKAFKLLGSRQWQKAIDAFELFRSANAQQKLQAEATRQLGLAYLASGQIKEAITEWQRISYLSDNANHQIDALWLAAELADMINDKQAVKIYRQFINRFPFPLQRSIEARQRLIEWGDRSGDKLFSTQWRVQLINVDAKGGNLRTQQSRYFAAKSRLKLVEPLMENYHNKNLSTPLNESLKIKTELMNEVEKAYKIAASYKVQPMLTAATYRIAEINMNLSLAIINSELPVGYNEKEQQQYDVWLNEKALAFKQKAIYFHEVNVSRLNEIDKNNIKRDVWIEKSIGRLDELVVTR